LGKYISERIITQYFDNLLGNCPECNNRLYNCHLLAKCIARIPSSGGRKADEVEGQHSDAGLRVHVGYGAEKQSFPGAIDPT